MSSTLTSGLSAGLTYSSLSVTATPDTIQAGEKVWVGIGLPSVEAFVATSGTGVGATTIPVVARVSTHNHLFGETVDPHNALSAVGRTMTPIQTQRTRKI